MARDLSHLTPPPVPSDERLDHATQILSRLSEVEAFAGWHATFHHHNAECTGVWPRDDEPGDLADLYVEIPPFYEDRADLGGSLDRQFARCRLAIRQAIERHDLELGLTREALEQSDARKAEA